MFSLCQMLGLYTVYCQSVKYYVLVIVLMLRLLLCLICCRFSSMETSSLLVLSRFS